MELELVNLTQYKISKDFFERILRIMQKKEEIKEECSIGVVLVGQGRIRNINKRYRGKNQVTDTLSFSFLEVQKPTKKDLRFIEPKETPKNLGEIFLCPSRIKKQAKKFKKKFNKELALVFIHGMLHLLGYEHKDTKTTKVMRKREKEILDSCLRSEELTSFLKESKIKHKGNNDVGRKKKSFTLIEVIISISIAMILFGIVIVGVPQMRAKGRDSIRIQDLDRVANALDSYYNREGCYPYGTDPTCGSGRNWTEMCNTLISERFLGEVPEDPINEGELVYSYCVDSKDSQGTRYTLMAKLEIWNQALDEDYDRDWPEGPPPQDNSCCKCRKEVGGCNPNPPAGPEWINDNQNSPPHTYCIRNP